MVFNDQSKRKKKLARMFVNKEMWFGVILSKRMRETARGISGFRGTRCATIYV